MGKRHLIDSNDQCHSGVKKKKKKATYWSTPPKDKTFCSSKPSNSCVRGQRKHSADCYQRAVQKKECSPYLRSYETLSLMSRLDTLTFFDPLQIQPCLTKIYKYIRCRTMNNAAYVEKDAEAVSHPLWHKSALKIHTPVVIRVPFCPSWTTLCNPPTCGYITTFIRKKKTKKKQKQPQLHPVLNVCFI